MCVSPNLLTQQRPKMKDANRRTARISASVLYLTLPSTTCVLHLQPVASLLRRTGHPPPAGSPPPLLNEEACVQYTSVPRVCVPLKNMWVHPTAPWRVAECVLLSVGVWNNTHGWVWCCFSLRDAHGLHCEPPHTHTPVARSAFENSSIEFIFVFCLNVLKPHLCHKTRCVFMRVYCSLEPVRECVCGV